MAPVQSFLTPTGRRVLDFGQNIAGRVRIEVTGAAGDVVTLRHAEVLDVDGELALRPLRLAKATDQYTLAGNGTRGVGAAVHLPRIPLRPGGRLARRR